MDDRKVDEVNKDEALDWLCRLRDDVRYVIMPRNKDKFVDALIYAIDVLQQERWNNHQVACLLADMFGDACACNFNGIGEWLPDLCDFVQKDYCCPKTVGVACWEQYLKHSKARYCECGYEVR